MEATTNPPQEPREEERNDGKERAHELFARYRERLQQIYGAYDALGNQYP